MIEDGVVDVSLPRLYHRSVDDGSRRCLKIFASLIFQLAARWTRHQRAVVRVCVYTDRVSIGVFNACLLACVRVSLEDIVSSEEIDFCLNTFRRMSAPIVLERLVRMSNYLVGAPSVVPEGDDSLSREQIIESKWRRRRRRRTSVSRV